MPAAIDLEEKKEYVAGLIADGVSHNVIISRLQISQATYYRRIKAWGLQKNIRIRNSTDQGSFDFIRGRIALWFYRFALSNKEIYTLL